MTSAVMILLSMPAFITLMKRKYSEGQPIYSFAPQAHAEKKTGTPTMGGLLLGGIFFVSILLWGHITSPFVWGPCMAFFAFGFLGYLDDMSKLQQRHFQKKSAYGMSMRKKFLLQIFIAAVCVPIFLYVMPYEEKTFLFFPLQTKWALPMGAVLYTLCTSTIFVGSANAVNLTDGLDGLASTCFLVTCGFLAVMAYGIGHECWAETFHMMHIPNAEEIVVVCGALGGAVAGFLWFNRYPARIFMGDTGSMALGAFCASVSMFLKQELLLGFIGSIFVVETLSVIIQVAVFRRTRKRVFLMTPLHHHFEEMGWSETKIVTCFWMTQMLVGLCALVFFHLV